MMHPRRRILSLIATALTATVVAACTTLAQEGRRPSGEPSSQEDEAHFREQQNTFYRQAIPTQHQTRIEISPAIMASLMKEDCGEYESWIDHNHHDSASRNAFLLKKLNRPFWFGMISNSDGNDYLLGERQDLHELLCIQKVINGGDLAGISAGVIDPTLQSQILDLPNINWPVFAMIVSEWEASTNTHGLLEKFCNHSRADIYSVDEATRIFFKEKFSAADRVKNLEKFYQSAIYQKNSEFFDHRMKIQLRAMPPIGSAPVIQYLADHKPDAFGRADLLDIAMRIDPKGDLTSLYGSISRDQNSLIKSALLISILSSNAQISNPDQLIEPLWLEYKAHPAENDFFNFLLDYEELRGRLSLNAIYEIYWQFLDLLPNSDAMKIAETSLMMDKEHFSFERRSALFLKACPLAQGNEQLAAYYLPTSSRLVREMPALFTQFQPCLSQFVKNFPNNSMIVSQYESALSDLQDPSVQMKYALDLIEHNYADYRFEKNLFRNAFNSQTENGYKIIKLILKNPALELHDLDQISIMVQNHASKTNSNDKDLLGTMDSLPLTTPEIKARNQQTLSGDWGHVTPADIQWDKLFDKK